MRVLYTFILCTFIRVFVYILSISSFFCSHKSPKVSQPCSHNIKYTTRRQYRHCANRNRFFLVLYTYIFFDIYFPIAHIHITSVLCIQISYNIYTDSVVAVVRENRKVIFLFFFFIFSFHFLLFFGCKGNKNADGEHHPLFIVRWSIYILLYSVAVATFLFQRVHACILQPVRVCVLFPSKSKCGPSAEW